MGMVSPTTSRTTVARPGSICRFACLRDVRWGTDKEDCAWDRLRKGPVPLLQAAQLTANRPIRRVQHIDVLLYARVPDELSDSFAEAKATFGFNDNFGDVELVTAEHLYSVTIDGEAH